MTAMMTKLPCKDGVSAQGNFQIMPVPHICGHATYMSFFVKFAGSNWSNKNVHASQVPISPHPHRRFETTHRSDIAVSYGSMEQLKDLPHFARELMSKATPQKRRRKKNIHNNIVHVSLNGFFYSYHKPQVFLVPFSQLIDICVKNHKY